MQHAITAMIMASTYTAVFFDLQHEYATSQPASSDTSTACVASAVADTCAARIHAKPMHKYSNGHTMPNTYAGGRWGMAEPSSGCIGHAAAMMYPDAMGTHARHWLMMSEDASTSMYVGYTVGWMNITRGWNFLYVIIQNIMTDIKVPRSQHPSNSIQIHRDVSLQSPSNLIFQNPDIMQYVLDQIPETVDRWRTESALRQVIRNAPRPPSLNTHSVSAKLPKKLLLYPGARRNTDIHELALAAVGHALFHKLKLATVVVNARRTTAEYANRALDALRGAFAAFRSKGYDINGLVVKLVDFGDPNTLRSVSDFAWTVNYGNPENTTLLQAIEFGGFGDTLAYVFNDGPIFHNVVETRIPANVRVYELTPAVMESSKIMFLPAHLAESNVRVLNLPTVDFDYLLDASHMLPCPRVEVVMLGKCKLHQYSVSFLHRVFPNLNTLLIVELEMSNYVIVELEMSEEVVTMPNVRRVLVALYGNDADLQHVQRFFPRADVQEIEVDDVYGDTTVIVDTYS